MNQAMPTLPRLSADLLLLHPPAYFEFRDRRDIYFPFLETSGAQPITPLYEYFPLGFKSLKAYLEEREHSVRIINLNTILLRYPKLPLDAVIEALDVRVVGIDLHWMVHVQGGLEIARRIKQLRPDIQTLFGGISATWYADELIQYPQVDMVMRGYDTHAPMGELLARLSGDGALSAVPNLLWKSRDGEVRDNGFGFLPDRMGHGIDWQVLPSMESKSLPILEVMTAHNAGCSYNCGWCGGSREAFRRIFGRKRAMVRKPADQVDYEFSTLDKIPHVERYHYFVNGSYNESAKSFTRFVDRVGETPFRSISYEAFHLPSDASLAQMARANRRTSITLSPESHDPEVARLSGRGVYSNEEMEAWIGRALDAGIQQIDIWYFVGMPRQDAASVQGTVEYCTKLLEKFAGKRVNPMLCVMMPFLDPGSTFFEHPDEHGYRIYHRTLEEHRAGMERASIIHRTNYETNWLTRRDLVQLGYRGVRTIMEAKAATGLLPRFAVRDYVRAVTDALEFIDVVHEADSIADPRSRARAIDALGDEILMRNDRVFFSGVSAQGFPVNREIGGRWFDEMGWEAEVLQAALEGGPERPREPADAQ